MAASETSRDRAEAQADQPASRILAYVTERTIYFHIVQHVLLPRRKTKADLETMLAIWWAKGRRLVF